MSLQSSLVVETHLHSPIRVYDLPELFPPEPVIDLHLSWLAQPASVATEMLPKDFESPLMRADQPVYDVKPKSPAHPLNGMLVHLQTQSRILLNQDASPIRLGKPNAQVMPDIDLSSFQNAEVVSRIHADILHNNQQFFIQDSGSANGTFVNGRRISPGNPYRLAPGDTISLGKGDLVTFTFELF